MQPSGADVLSAFVDEGRVFSDGRDAIFGKREVNALGGHQRDVLLDQRTLGLGENADELGLAERVELHANRKAALELGNQVRRLRDMKRAGGDEQDVIGAHHAVLGVDRRAFNDRQDVTLDAFTTDFRPVTAFTTGDLVDLVNEDDARLFDPLDCGG